MDLCSRRDVIVSAAAFLISSSRTTFGQDMPISITSTSIPTLPFVAWHNVVSDPVAPHRYVWTLGGQRYDGVSMVRGDCFKIDLQTNAVVASFTVPWWFAHTSAIEVGGKIRVIGGLGNKGTTFTALTQMQTVDLVLMTVSVTPAMAQMGYDIEASAQAGRDAFIYGGGHGWDAGRGVSWARWEAGCVDCAAGGTAVAQIPGGLVSPRSYATSHALSNGNVLFIGGMAYGANMVEQYRNLATIEEVSTSGSVVWPARLSEPKRYHSSRRLVGNPTQIVVAGGTSKGFVAGSGRPAATRSVDLIDTAQRTVTPLAPLIAPRYHAQTAAVYMDGRDYLLLIGGQSDNGIPVTTIELYDIADQTSQVIGTCAPHADHDRISVCVGSKVVAVGGADCSLSPERGTNTLLTIEFPAGVQCLKA